MRTRFILVQGPLWIDARPYKYMYAVVAVVIDQWMYISGDKVRSYMLFRIIQVRIKVQL